MTMLILDTGIVLDQGLDIESSRSFMELMSTSKDEVSRCSWRQLADEAAAH